MIAAALGVCIARYLSRRPDARLREVGCDIDADPRSGLFEIRGVPGDLILAMSRRAEQSDALTREHGLEGQGDMSACHHCLGPLAAGIYTGPPDGRRSIKATVMLAPVSRTARGGPACPAPITIAPNRSVTEATREVRGHEQGARGKWSSLISRCNAWPLVPAGFTSLYNFRESHGP